MRFARAAASAIATSRDGLHVIETHFDPEKMTVLQLYLRFSASLIAVVLAARKRTGGSDGH
jgi:hypothetical protein